MLSSKTAVESIQFLNPANNALATAETTPSATSLFFDENQPRDLLFDSLDLQNLPGLMSPDPLPKNYPEDAAIDDEDDDIDECEVFSPLGQNQSRNRPLSFHSNQSSGHAMHLLNPQYFTPDIQQHIYTHHSQGAGQEKAMTHLQIVQPNHPMVLQRTASMTSFDSLFIEQQQQPHHHHHSSAVSHQQQYLLSSSHTQFNAIPTFNTALPHHQHQHQQQQQQQQQMHFQRHVHQQNSLLPSITPIRDYNQVSPQSSQNPGDFDQYLSTLPSQPRPALENTIPTADQEMDLLLSSMNLSSPSSVDNSAMVSIQSSFLKVQSPALSWVSRSNLTSRESSPGLSPELLQKSMTTAATEIMSPLFSSLSSSPSADLTASSAPPSLFTGPSAPSSPTSPSSTPAPKRRRHRVRPPTVKKPKKIKPTSFPCAEPDCDKKFSRAYNLTSHMKTHSTDRPFPCGICDLAFARRHDRERHFRLHSGDKPYNCGICGAGFMRNDALHRHQKLCGAAGSVFSIMSTDYFEEQQQQRMMMQQQLQQNQGEGFVDESTEGATELSLDYFKFE